MKIIISFVQTILLIGTFKLSYSQYKLEPIDFSSSSSSCDKSPINIPYETYDKGGLISYPAIPEISLNRTFYSKINGLNFSYYTSNDNANNSKLYGPFYHLDNDNANNPENVVASNADLKMKLNDLNNKAYVNYRGSVISYDLKEIRLRYYSEHTFGGFKTDLEIQLMHDLTDGQSGSGAPEKIGIAILFSTIRDKKNKLIQQLIEEDKFESNPKYKYRFAKVKSLDFNQFVNFENPHYTYDGQDTVYCNQKKVQWFVMKEVYDMKYKQLEKIQYAMTNLYPNGNARPIPLEAEDTKVQYISGKVWEK